jgi:hypothetical protein
LAALGSASAAAQESTLRAPHNAPPKYCKPCLFYAGDFDATNTAANGLYNENSSAQQGEAYVPFTVPRGKKWHVTGLAINLLGSDSVIPSSVYWEIRTHMSSGVGGTLVASGTSSSTSPGQFNCGGIEVYCFTLLTKGVKATLPSGKYWLTSVPQCQNTDCDSVEYFLADVEDIPPHNYYGRLEPWDDSFFNSNTFGYSYAPTWGPSGVCAGAGCDRFSAAVLGTSTGAPSASAAQSH